MGANITLQNQVAIDNARIAGTQKHCMSQASILVESVSYTPQEVIDIYQADLDGMADVASAKLTLADARAKAKPAAIARQNFDRGYKKAIEGAYGNSPATMGDFGIVVSAPKPPTVKVKAAALAQAEATRILRGTKGSKQKAAIKATPTPVPPAAPPQSKT